MPWSDFSADDFPITVSDIPDSGTPTEEEVQDAQRNWDGLNTFVRYWVGDGDPTDLAETIFAALGVADLSELIGATGESGPGSESTLVWTPWDAAQDDGDFEPAELKAVTTHKTLIYPAGIDPEAVTGFVFNDGDYFDEITIV